MAGRCATTPLAELESNARLEAFCDRVFAIAITLLVIDLRFESPDSLSIEVAATLNGKEL